MKVLETCINLIILVCVCLTLIYISIHCVNSNIDYRFKTKYIKESFYALKLVCITFSTFTCL